MNRLKKMFGLLALASAGVLFVAVGSAQKIGKTSGGGLENNQIEGDVAGNSPSVKKAISADGFDTSIKYNLNDSGNSINGYFESLSFTQKTRNGSTQQVEIGAPYSIYSTDTIRIGTKRTAPVSCGNSYDNQIDYNLQNLEYNDQPHVTSLNKVVVAGYSGETFIKNLSFTLSGNSLSTTSKYYLQGLKINITLDRDIDNYRISLNDVIFTTGYNTSSISSSTKHVTTSYQEAQYRYYAFSHYSKGSTYITGNGGTFQIPKVSSSYIGGSYLHSYSKTWDYSGNWVQIGDGSQQTGGGQYVSIDGSNHAYIYVEGSTSGSIGKLYAHGTGQGGSSAYSAVTVGFSYSVYNAVENYSDLGIHGASWGNSNSYHHRDLVANEVGEVSHQDTTTTVTWNGNTTGTSSFTKSFSLDDNNPVTTTAYNRNVSDVWEWYEAPTSESGVVKSFNTYETAFNHVKETITNSIVNRDLVYNSTDLNNYCSPLGSYEFTDGFNTNTTKDYIYFRTKPGSMGLTYPVKVVPEYNDSGSNANSIRKLWAFTLSEESEMNAFIEEQAAKFVHHKNIFDSSYPADNFAGENVVTNDLNYVSTLEIDNAYTVNVKEKALTDNSLVDGSQSSTSQIQTLYSYENNFVGISPTDYSYAYMVGSYSDSDWLDIAEVSGSVAFTNFYNSAIVNDDSSISYVITREELEAGSNKITFNSNDKMFVRITKDDEEANILTASTTYNLSDSNFVSVASSTSPQYQFTEPGVYKIEMANRNGGDANKRTITVKIYDENDLYASAIATNYQLNLNINNPAPAKDHVYINDIEIYEVDNRVDHEDSRYYVEPVAVRPTIDSHFTKLTEDDLGNNIAPSTSTANMQYTFKKDDASYENQFNKCYYVEITLQNFTKRYYLYWNYIQPDANNLSISLTNPDWEKNVGYEVGYIPVFTYAAGEHTDTPTTVSQQYNYTISNPDVIEIDRDNQKIKAIGEGDCTVTFSLAHAIAEEERTPDDILSVTFNFSITDLDELRKEIRVSEEDITLALGEDKEFAASVNPSWKDQELTYTSSNEGVVKYEDGKLISVAPGTATITIHSDDVEISDKVVNVTVNGISEIFSNSSQIGFVNDNIGIDFEVYAEDKVTAVSSDESIARYNNESKEIELVGEGSASIIFSYYGNEQTIELIVLQSDLKDGLVIPLGDYYTITYPNDDINISSSNEGVLEVNNSLLETVGKGNVQVTFTPNNPNIGIINIPVIVSSDDALISNMSKITFVGENEVIIPHVADTSKLQLSSSDENVCYIDTVENKFVFNNPGEALITVSYMGENQVIRFVVLESWMKEDINFELGEGKSFTNIDGVNVTSSTNKVVVEEDTAKAVQTGKSNITISVDDSSLVAHTIQVTVVAPERVATNSDHIGYVGSSFNLNTEVIDIDALEVTIQKEDILSFDKETLSFTPLKEGSTNVTITYYDQSYTFKVYVLQENLMDNFEANLGESIAITYPGNDLIFSTSDKNVIGINNGKIIFKGDGVATFTVEARNNEEIKNIISITVNAPTSISDNKNKIIKVGETETLKYLVSDEAEVKVSISDNKILSYDAETKTIEGLKPGEVTITLTYYDQEQVLKYMVIEKEISVPLLDSNGKTLTGEFNEVTKETTVQSKSLKVDIPEGYEATLNDQPYNGEEITEEGEYVLKITRKYKADEYSNEVNETLIYRVIIVKNAPDVDTSTATSQTSYGMEGLVVPLVIVGSAVVIGVVTIIVIKKRKVGSMKK